MEAKLIEVLGENAEAVKERVNLRISKEIKEATRSLERSLNENERCSVCTLKYPCTHGFKQQSRESFEVKPTVKVNYWRIKSREKSIQGIDLKTLEKVGDFQERRIKDEINELKQFQVDEEVKKEEKKTLEEKRIRHANGQKKKLEKYQLDIIERKKIMLSQIKDNILKQKQEEAKFKLYLEIQKKKISEKYDNYKCTEHFYKMKT